MDEPLVTDTVLRFSPDRRLTAGLAAAVAVIGLAAAVTSDDLGRLMLIGAAVLLACYVVTDLVYAPRITATPAGLVLNAPFARARLDWSDVDSVRADSRQRLGLRATTLEIEAGPLVAVFSRRALGADPEQAAALITALDPRPARDR